MIKNYHRLPKGSILNEEKYLKEINQAIKSCEGYVEGMRIVKSENGGIELQINGKVVIQADYDFIMKRADELVRN